MATLEQLNAALIKADAAGDSEGAKMLADEIRRVKTPIPEKKEQVGGFSQSALDLAGGLLRGAGSVGATILAPWDMAKDAIDGKGLSLQSNRERRQAMDEALPDFGVQPDSGMFKIGKIGAEIMGTAGAGGAVAKGVQAVAPVATASGFGNRLVQAIGSGGMTVGAGGNTGTNMLARILGGAVSGGAQAGLVNPADAPTGVAVGAALPPVLQGVGYAAKGAGSLVRPFFGYGQKQIAGDVLRASATNPTDARAALATSTALLPGSDPITATASGDAGLAALSRAMQNADPRFASELAARQTAQNQARTAALEGVAGNTGKISLAEAARDASTGPMREAVLDAAGNVPSRDVLSSLDRLIRDPNNAGELAQQALNKFRSRIEQFSQDGTINARALYEIRKDINTLQQGKLQGDAGNLRYASGQLTAVKGLIDDAIDKASRTVLPGSLENAATSARPSWKGYLQSYAQQSIPINQMERLDEILKSIQTGTVDSQGGSILSAAKLNNFLKNKGSDLIKELSPEQLSILRNIQADLNAGQIANNVGRAVGSNTVQNLAQNQLLNNVLGTRLGGSTAATSTLGRLLQLPYGTANKQIQERLGNALLNPQEAAQLMADPRNNRLFELLATPAARVAPVLTAQ